MSVGVVNLSESKGGFVNYFEFFQLPKQFGIDRPLLDQAYLKVQQEVHPDRHVTGSDSEKRQSLQIATFANTAYQTLKQPLKRGFYLCELAGLDPQLETNTSMPTEFLMHQMELREAMDDAKGNLTELSRLQSQVQNQLNQYILTIGEKFDQEKNVTIALERLRAALFLERFIEEIDYRISELS
jgi:molecular chaperone HscB